MNTASNSELEDFENSVAPERFELNAPSNNTLLPSANASVSRRDLSSVEIDWSSEPEGQQTISAESVMAGIEQSVRRRTERFPRSARAHANLGLALLKNGQSAEARKELETALEFDSSNYIAGITLGRLHFESGRTDEAAACYEKLLALHPNDVAVEIGLFNVLTRLGRQGEAFVHLTNAASLDKRNPYTHFLLGLLSLQRSDIRSALNEFRAASHIDSRNPDIYHAIGVAYALQGDHLRAAKAFKTALNLAPNSVQTVISLSRTLLAFRKSDQAIEMLKGYLDLHPDEIEARDQLAIAYIQTGRHSAARTQLGQILEEGGHKLSKEEIARHHTNIAVSFMHERSFDKAKRELKVAIDTAPKGSHVPYENLARVYALTGRVPLGIEVLKTAINLFPSSREARSILSVLYAEQEDYSEAIAQIETLQSEGPLSDENYASLGTYYEESGLIRKAIEVLMEGYAKYPKSRSIINNLAYCLLMNGQVAPAREVLNARARNVEDHVEMVATIGLLHLKEGDYDGARRLYKRAESMATKSSRKDLARRVRQKMHLELARHHLEQREYAEARREIDAGLHEKMGRRSFLVQLEAMARSVEERT